MKGRQWLDRADRALASAPVLIEIGDADRACSSAYYAMFYATRAALFHVGQPERALGKTHSGMIAAFNQFLVRPGIIEASIGRMLQVEFSRRLVADYEAEGVGTAQAIEAIDNARSFLAAVRAIL